MPTDWKQLQSKTIDTLRFPMAVAVVMLHSCTIVLSDSTGLLRGLCILFQEGICRLAVPCFFFISGFLFFNKLQEWSWDEWSRKIKNRAKTLLLPYLLWNVIALLAYWIWNNLHGDHVSLYQQFLNYGGLRMFWSKYGGLPLGSQAIPADGPLWFIRDLMYFILATPLIYKFLQWTRIYGVLGLCVLFLAVRRVVPEGFLFFVIGAYLQISRKNILEIVFPKRHWLLCLALLFLVAVCLLYDYSEYWSRFFKFFFLVSGIGASFYLAARSVEYRPDRPHPFLVSSSFFIFAAHEILILHRVARPLAEVILPTDTVWGGCAAIFLTPAFAIAICLGLLWLMRRILPRTTGLLTGNRKIQNA